MFKRKICLFFLSVLSVTLGALFNLIAVDKTLSISPYTTTYSKFVERCHSICHYDSECKSFDFTKTSDSEGICSFYDVYVTSDTNQSMALVSKPGARLFSKVNLYKKDCAHLYRDGNRRSGLYEIRSPLHPQRPLKVYCNMELDGGGWTVFQRRYDGSVEFKTRTWAEYKEGFGNAPGEYWLGNEVVHRLTTSEKYDYMVWAKAFDGETAKRKLLEFKLGNEQSGYRFNHEGMAPGYENQPIYAAVYDNTNLNGASFKTYDQGGCALSYGAWWFLGCHRYAMNGGYPTSNDGTALNRSNGIIWVDFRNPLISLKESMLMIRPKWF